MQKHGCMTEYIISAHPITWMYDKRYIQHNIYMHIYIGVYTNNGMCIRVQCICMGNIYNIHGLSDLYLCYPLTFSTKMTERLKLPGSPFSERRRRH